ncbi:hypothetical protein L2750_03010 [Shewanella submarina]|uniref:Uncharacterized protein n=1 Tax=Shewanella submarina TaxID=2016376 RepID=A0ABV7GKA7_9GAMM|nr:hypothetical protein [Shewanella submarina]MCL1036126.1 hypothetical protein [Shewanella submarina]
MLHIKDKSLFSLKILSFEYIKLKLENPGQQDITQSPKYRNEAYSYQVLARVADIDDSFEQIKSREAPIALDDLPGNYLELVDRCYLLVGTAIGLDETQLQPGCSRDSIRSALRQYPEAISSRLQQIEYIAKKCRHTKADNKFILDKCHSLKVPKSKDGHSPCCINDLHRSVADLQFSLKDVFSMKLQRIH